MLAVPFFLGGVTAGEFWRMTLVLLTTLLFSLATGLLVSALSVVSCSSGDDGLSGPSSDQTPAALLGSTGGSGILGTDIGSGLLACTPLPYAMTQQTVGTAGGTLLVGPLLLSYTRP